VAHGGDEQDKRIQEIFVELQRVSPDSDAYSRLIDEFRALHEPSFSDLFRGGARATISGAIPSEKSPLETPDSLEPWRFPGAGVQPQPKTLSEETVRTLATALKVAVSELAKNGYGDDRHKLIASFALNGVKAQQEKVAMPYLKAAGKTVEKEVSKRVLKAAASYLGGHIGRNLTGPLAAVERAMDFMEIVKSYADQVASNMASSQREYVEENGFDDHAASLADLEALMCLPSVIVGARKKVYDGISAAASSTASSAVSFAGDCVPALAAQVEYEQHDAEMEAEAFRLIGSGIVGVASDVLNAAASLVFPSALNASAVDPKPKSSRATIPIMAPAPVVREPLPAPVAPVYSTTINPDGSKTVDYGLIAATTGAVAGATLAVTVTEGVAVTAAASALGGGSIGVGVALTGAAATVGIVGVAGGALGYGVYKSIEAINEHAAKVQFEEDVMNLDRDLHQLSTKRNPFLSLSSLEKTLEHLKSVARTDEQRSALGEAELQITARRREADLKAAKKAEEIRAIECTPEYRERIRALRQKCQGRPKPESLSDALWQGLADAGAVGMVVEEVRRDQQAKIKQQRTSKSPIHSMGGCGAGMAKGLTGTGGVAVVGAGGAALPKGETATTFLGLKKATVLTTVQTAAAYTAAVAVPVVVGGAFMYGVHQLTNSVLEDERRRVENWRRDQRFLERIAEVRDNLLERAFLVADTHNEQAVLRFVDQRLTAVQGAFTLNGVASVEPPPLLVLGDEMVRFALAQEFLDQPGESDADRRELAKIAAIIAVDYAPAVDRLRAFFPAADAAPQL
jgi:hypothetical protein